MIVVVSNMYFSLLEKDKRREKYVRVRATRGCWVRATRAAGLGLRGLLG